MTKKAQTWVGFLMSYGWLVFVLIIGTAALFYWGILDLDMFTPQCDLPAGFLCVQHSISVTGLTLVIQNTLGQDITLTSVTDVSGNCTAQGDTISNGQTLSITASGCNREKAGTHYRTVLELQYISATGLQYTRQGKLSGTIE